MLQVRRLLLLLLCSSRRCCGCGSVGCDAAAVVFRLRLRLRCRSGGQTRRLDAAALDDRAFVARRGAASMVRQFTRAQVKAEGSDNAKPLIVLYNKVSE